MKIIVFVASLIAFVSAQFAGKSSCIEYDNIPEILDYNVVSIGFASAGAKQVRNIIEFASITNIRVDQVVVVFSVQTPASDHLTYFNELWTHPITLRIYNISQENGTYSAGSLLFNKTKNFTFLWRPEQHPNCTNGKWLDPHGNCRTGIAAHVIFDFNGSPLVMPSEIIYGIGYNTQHTGFESLNIIGPYQLLHLGLTTGIPSKGIDLCK